MNKITTEAGSLRGVVVDDLVSARRPCVEFIPAFFSAGLNASFLPTILENRSTISSTGT